MQKLAINKYRPNVEVSEHALLRRVNRKLARAGEIMRKSRGAKEVAEFGEYHVVDSRNCIVAWYCDLEDVAREVKALGDREKLDRTEETAALQLVRELETKGLGALFS